MKIVMPFVAWGLLAFVFYTTKPSVAEWFALGGCVGYALRDALKKMEKK